MPRKHLLRNKVGWIRPQVLPLLIFEIHFYSPSNCLVIADLKILLHIDKLQSIGVGPNTFQRPQNSIFSIPYSDITSALSVSAVSNHIVPCRQIHIFLMRQRDIPEKHMEIISSKYEHTFLAISKSRSSRSGLKTRSWLPR